MTYYWSYDSIFYHIYPLGFCGAPERNDFNAAPVPRLEKLYTWLDHLQYLGITALYLGPLFESSAHGYDTADYYHVDRRLGTDETLAKLSAEIHRRGMRLVLDGVFNHTGRDFWAFRDVRQLREGSIYCGWFQGLNFSGRSPYGDPFSYDGWNGHYDLVKLNLSNPWVREHLFGAIAQWVCDYDIDGLRLDAADCLSAEFLGELASTCRRLKPDFWLVGEVIHGDYRKWANPTLLDSVTNYECYKGLYSSHVDHNYYEIAYALNRQFGEVGLYRQLPLYAFADNHDVNRAASSLEDGRHLYPLYCLLMTMPGVPSIYYGSEWGIRGVRTPHSDRALRPCLELAQAAQNAPQPGLAQVISRLARIRRSNPALCRGSYRQLHVSHEQLAFLRQSENESAVVMVNAADQSVDIEMPVPLPDGTRLQDALDGGEKFQVQNGRLCIRLQPHWARILIKE
jgi:cyclomaltodextrinase / maltogenic alpha-amylase / neopullulanase